MDILFSDENFRKKIIDLNTNSQLYAGLDANGESIKPPYAPSTIAKKRRLGQPIDRVTLKYTGDFYKSFKLNFTKDILIKAETLKNDFDLQDKYGDILGLNEKSLKELIEMAKEIIQEYLKEKLYAKFI